MTDRPVITVDPAVRFGRPHIGGVSSEAIAGMVMAGEPLERVAGDYGLTRHEVLLACWWEGAGGVYRKEWLEWADLVRPKLAGWVSFDPDAEPGPPDRTELLRL